MNIKNENFDFALVTDEPVSLTSGMGTGSDNDNTKGMSNWDVMLVRVGRDRDKALLPRCLNILPLALKVFCFA